MIEHLWADEAGPRDRPLVALVHGSMDRSTGLLRLSRRLDDRWRVLRYDRRGYGRSAPHAGPFTMDRQVEDLIGLLAGRRAVIVGHSYGGNVALATAARRPDLVAALALFEVPMSWEPWWPGSTAGAAARATEGTPADAAERFMRTLVGDVAWEALPDKTRATRRQEGEAMVAELRDLQANRPWQAEDVACPAVVGFGSRGREHHRHGMEFLHRALPGSVLVEVPDAAHDGPHDRPGAIAQSLVEPALRLAGSPWLTESEP